MAHKTFYVTRIEDEQTHTAGAATLNRADNPQLIKIFDTAEDIDPTALETNEVVGTKEADFEAVSIVDRVTVDNMNPVTSNAVANVLSYSTEEVLTGGYWIDGKPIYRKAGFKSGNVGNTILDSYLTTSVVDKVIDVGGCYTNNEDNMQSVGGYSSANFRACLGVKSNGLLYYSSGDTPHDCSWWIEYTKVTD